MILMCLKDNKYLMRLDLTHITPKKLEIDEEIKEALAWNKSIEIL